MAWQLQGLYIFLAYFPSMCELRNHVYGSGSMLASIAYTNIEIEKVSRACNNGENMIKQTHLSKQGIY